MRALVAFTGESAHPLAGWLKPGFRHVAVAVEDRLGLWVLIDAAEGLPRIQNAGSDINFTAGYLTELGYTTLVRTHQKADAPPWPLTVASCTGMVKAVLGINAPLTLTPHALYRHLCKEKDSVV